MKRAYLIHGWSGRPEHGFFPWLKRELEGRGYVVFDPQMPDTDAPALGTWVPFVERLVGEPDDETLIVGHSMGGQTALRYLERLLEGARVGKVALVAPVVEAILDMSPEEEAIARPWLDRAFDDAKIRRSAASIVGIFSDDDRWIPLSSERIVRERFGGKTVVLSKRGHFSGDDGCRKLPELLEFI
jgi:predicted alpha/beta hydrolase family esterase